MLNGALKKHQGHNCKTCGQPFTGRNLFDFREKCCRLSPPPNGAYPMTNIMSEANIEFLKWVDILPSLWCFNTWRSEGLNIPDERIEANSYCNLKVSNLPFGVTLKIFKDGS